MCRHCTVLIDSSIRKLVSLKAWNKSKSIFPLWRNIWKAKNCFCLLHAEIFAYRYYLKPGWFFFFWLPPKPPNMAIVLLIFLSIGRERSAEKQRAFLMAGSECAGLDVSESAAGSQSRACWRVLCLGGLAAQWDSQHLHIFGTARAVCMQKEKSSSPSYMLHTQISMVCLQLVIRSQGYFYSW